MLPERTMLAHAPDNDILRGLGCATLCAAYAEEQVDHILELLHRVEPFDDKTRKAPIEQRLARASAIVQRLASDELFELERTLAAGAALFARRDEIVHGRLYPGLERSDALQAAKPKVTQRPAAAQELYALANEFAVYRDALIRPQVMRLPRAVTEYLGRAAPPHFLEAP